MRTCERCSSGELELYFYDELPRADRSTVEQHLSACRECRAALDELHEIRAALASRPDVSAPASGDWSAFMSRLDASLVSERPHPGTVAPVARVHSPYVAYLAMAALLTLVTVSVMVALRSPQPTTAPAASSVVRPRQRRPQRMRRSRR